MNIPANLRYTKEHEWILIEGNIATVGITEFAQGELGDIVYVEIETTGQALREGDVFGSVEAVKTVSDLFLPVDGTVLEINTKVVDSPEVVNSDPYGEGWMIKLQVNDPAAVGALMDAEAYRQLVGG
ncbi:MAG: glycine cleavage system protein GcvH [Cytophagaceae bacterium]|nr:glycine cleavage system protein GcvH [Cytophagaceae bacterium]